MVKSKIALITNKNCNIENIIMLFTLIISMIIKIIIISSLINIENNIKCKCSNLPHRFLLKEWFIISLFLNLIMGIFFGISNENCWKNFNNYPFIYTFNIIHNIIDIIMLIRLFLYIRILKNKCKCSYNKTENIIYWYLLIYISIFIAFIIILFLIILLSIIKFK